MKVCKRGNHAYEADKSYCPQCKDARSRRWKANHPEYQRAYYSRRRDDIHEQRVMQRYGLARGAYQALLETQHGSCRLCRLPDSGGQRLAVDHDHDTGAVRGLLCKNCNVRLGHVEMALKDEAWLSVALQYSERLQAAVRTR